MEIVMTKREIANRILEELFADKKRIPIATAVKVAKDQDVSLTTLRRASRNLKIKEIHNGNQPAFWEKGE